MIGFTEEADSYGLIGEESRKQLHGSKSAGLALVLIFLIVANLCRRPGLPKTDSRQHADRQLAQDDEVEAAAPNAPAERPSYPSALQKISASSAPNPDLQTGRKTRPSTLISSLPRGAPGVCSSVTSHT